MRRFFLALIIFIPLPFFLLAQKEKATLPKGLAAYTTRDSVRANLLLAKAEDLIYKKPQEALTVIDEALAISEEQRWYRGEAAAYNIRGKVYYAMANNLNAMDAYQASLKIAESIHDENLIATLYNNLGNIHADAKQFGKAIENYENYLSFSEKLGVVPNQIKALNNIGNVLNENNKMDDAIGYFDKALKLSKQIDNTFFRAAIINNLGVAYKRKKDYKNALQSFNEALELSLEIENKYIEASALNSLGKVNILLEHYDSANFYAQKALKLSEEIVNVEWQADSWEVLQEVYENEDNLALAFSAYKNYIQLRDSVSTEEKKAEVTRKDMQFQMEKQDALAKTEIKRQTFIRNTAVGAGMVLLLLSLFGYVLYKKKRDAQAQRKAAELKTKIAETELKALRSQMNPHFIFNSLNSISDYLSQNDVEKANDYLIKFSKLTRAILENSEKEMISLADDLELLKLYVEIESLRLKNKLSYHVKIDKEIDPENTLVPPLLLQPFIENSIWHGIAHMAEEGAITVEIKKDNQKLICTVNDNGVGRNNILKNNNKNQSMGINITNSRLEILNEIKKVNGSINFLDKKEGLKVELTLPLEILL